MIKEFTQKKGIFSSRKFTLTEDRLIIREKTISNITQHEIFLDRIGYDKYYKADNVIIGKAVTVFTIFMPFLSVSSYINGKIELSLLVFFFGFCWFLVLMSVLKSNQDDIILTGGSVEINFYRNKPNEKDVSSFINEIIYASKKYMKEKYLKFEEYSSKEEYWEILKYLKNRNILSESEFSLLKEEYGKEFI